VASGKLSVPANRSIACRTAPARRIDSLHWRCLTSNLFASGGGAVAFIANIAINSSRVISDRGMTYPFDPMARENVRRLVPVSSGPVSVAVAISGYEGVSRSRTCSMLICGAGSGMRDPLKTNSRGKLVVFSVVVAISFSKMMVDGCLPRR
jgi:hypothetical protein